MYIVTTPTGDYPVPSFSNGVVLVEKLAQESKCPDSQIVRTLESVVYDVTNTYIYTVTLPEGHEFIVLDDRGL